MPKTLKEILSKIPIVNRIVDVLRKIKLPGLVGLTLYDLLELYAIGIFKGALTSRASAIAFSFFTAIFPFLLFVLILMPYIPIDGFQQEFQGFLTSVLPPQTSDFFFSNIFENIENTERGGLLSSVFVISIMLMANGVNSVFSGFENSYHQEHVRNIFKQYLYALGVALILAILVILTVAFFMYFQLYVIQPLYEQFDKLDYVTQENELFWVVFVKYLFFVFMVYIATAVLYYFGTKSGKTSKFFSIGALFTTLLIILTSYFFGIYIENFSQYNKLYGSIGALLILLLYLWLNSNILLLGYELNATIRRLKRKDDDE
ncbi:YihY/virulence factor BrkB family protein [Psychroserpens damuponensis]|uniref:YihY/virulence factor BrkB family protein n=1 Tax=Psychroserpens damuponensis TaxID=943936 RepID=UPI00058E78DC|nr:YihY/virulence factor BrkB family protein [Psychroserpens damuponensis]